MYSVVILAVSHWGCRYELGRKLVQMTLRDVVTISWYVGQKTVSELWVSPL